MYALNMKRGLKKALFVYAFIVLNPFSLSHTLTAKMLAVQGAASTAQGSYIDVRDQGKA